MVQARRAVVTDSQRNHLENSHCQFYEVGECIKIIQKNKSYYVKVVVWAQDCFQWQIFCTSSILTLGFCYWVFIASQLCWYDLNQWVMNIVWILYDGRLKCIKSCAVQCKRNYILIFPFFKWVITILSFRKKYHCFFI
jgi:hypothetical protein